MPIIRQSDHGDTDWYNAVHLIQLNVWHGGRGIGMDEGQAHIDSFRVFEFSR
jgi:hypothetical protein